MNDMVVDNIVEKYTYYDKYPIHNENSFQDYQYQYFPNQSLRSQNTQNEIEVEILDEENPNILQNSRLQKSFIDRIFKISNHVKD